MSNRKFSSDLDAMNFLESRGFSRTNSCGVYYFPSDACGNPRQLDADEIAAVDYLCNEWDYSFKPEY